MPLGHKCPRCESEVYYAERMFRCASSCGFTTTTADWNLWKIIVNLQRVLHAVEGMLVTLPAMEKRHEGPPTDFYNEVLKDTAFKRAD